MNSTAHKTNGKRTTTAEIDSHIPLRPAAETAHATRVPQPIRDRLAHDIRRQIGSALISLAPDGAAAVDDIEVVTMVCALAQLSQIAHDIETGDAFCPASPSEVAS